MKFLHTRIRVSNLDTTIDFYQKLGFKLRDRKDSPQGNKLAFLEIPDSEHFLELCYSPDFKVDFPEDLMHTCVGVDDVIAYCDKLENDGIEIWPENWRSKFADPANRQMAFVTDPDGYEVEILPL
ncbi:VOC family protein [Rubritalea tangerina]|uniref:Aldoketomutase n=1 Tax=Rubritalea tangerina TaxID=430798 RepID=A0ABW4Z8A9_9BACT